ncbi:lipopolysaccharide biosynthesis protein [Actinophytocola xinjiangensis]|nr:hypothetical protein [Actinophytocola xinjiangensis]
MVSLRQRFGPALYMGGGLALVGAAGFGFVSLAGHTLPAVEFAAITNFYLMVNIIGPGLFSALEQETSRSVSAGLAGGRALGPIVGHAWKLAAGLLAAVLVVLLAVSGPLTDAALAGTWGLVFAVLLSVATSAAVYLVRGVLGGTQRFNGYAATLGAEGLARILPCVVIALSGVPNAVGYALFFAAGSGVGALAGLLWLRRPSATSGPSATKPTGTAAATTETTPDVPEALPGAGREMARGFAFLVGGTVLMLVVMNVAPIVITPRLGGDAATAAAFGSAFVLARIPLFLFAPVQAMLLPALTRAATRGEYGEVRATLRKILVAVAAIGIPGVAASFLVGPWAVQVVFGADVRLSGTVVGLLGLSTIGLMVGQVLQPGLIALGRHRSVTGAWLLSAVVLVGLLALPGDPIRAGVTAQLAGAALVVVIMLVTLSRALGNRPAPTGTSAGVAAV